MTDPKNISFPPEVEKAIKDIGHWNNRGKGGDGSALLEEIKGAFAGQPGQAGKALHDISLDIYDATDLTPKRAKGNLPENIKTDLSTIGGPDLVEAYQPVVTAVETPGNKVPKGNGEAMDKANAQLIGDLKKVIHIAPPLSVPNAPPSPDQSKTPG